MRDPRLLGGARSATQLASSATIPGIQSAFPAALITKWFQINVLKIKSLAKYLGSIFGN